MATINNQKLIQNIINEAKIQTSHDRVPTQLAEKIVPVLIANPKRIIQEIAAATSTGTMMTTPTDRDFYLTNVQVSAASFEQDATKDTSVGITLPNGNTIAIAYIWLRTGAAASESNDSASLSLNFNIPIKIKRGTNITFTNTSTTAIGIIYGYSTAPQYLDEF